MGLILTLVDENDTVIGRKDSSILAATDIFRVARLLIINSKGQLLLAQRAFTKRNDPGLWGLAVEGRVEDGETYESNIRKEAAEEIGIEVDNLELGSKLRMTGKYNHYCQFFVYRADLRIDQLVLQKEEVEMAQWFDMPALQRELSAHPEKFGYRFDLILEQALPFVSSR